VTGLALQVERAWRRGREGPVESAARAEAAQDAVSPVGEGAGGCGEGRERAFKTHPHNVPGLWGGLARASFFFLVVERGWKDMRTQTPPRAHNVSNLRGGMWLVWRGPFFTACLTTEPIKYLSNTGQMSVKYW
jgi:hypothetical protein